MERPSAADCVWCRYGLVVLNGVNDLWTKRPSRTKESVAQNHTSFRTCNGGGRMFGSVVLLFS